MSNIALNTIFAIVDLLTSIRDANTNTVLVQTGSVTEEYGDCDNAEYWGTIGVASRPAQPAAKSSAAQGIAIRFGDRHRIIATRDVRGQEIYGNLDEGETCLYAGGPDGAGQARVYLRKDGSVAMVTTHDNTSDGNTVMRSCSPDPMQGFVDFSPWGSVKLNATGYHVMLASGARLDGSGMSAPGVPAAIGSWWTLQAGKVGLKASIVNLGPLPATMFPVALATPLLAYFTAFQLALIAAATAAGSAAAVGDGGHAAFAAFVTALTAIAPAPPTIASTSTNSN